MKKLTSILFVVLFVHILTGCANQSQRLSTPSGKPEITIIGSAKKQIIDTLVNQKLGDGFQVKSANDYSLVVAKDIDDFAAKVAYGSDYNRTPEARVTYNFVDTSGGVKVFVHSDMVTNPNSPYEKVTNFTSTWGDFAQTELKQLKVLMEKK